MRPISLTLSTRMEGADLGEIHSILLDHGARCESEVKMIARELEVGPSTDAAAHA